MKKPTELKVICSFQIYECDSIKSYLEDMSKKGWLLFSINNCFFCFKRIRPKTLYYAIELFIKNSFYDTTDEENNEYIALCRESGWDFVCNSGSVNIFVTDTKSPFPIDIRNELKIKNLTKPVISTTLAFLFVIPLCVLIQVISWSNTDFNNLIFLELMPPPSLYLFIFLMLEAICQIMGLFIFTINLKSRLKYGKSPYLSKKTCIYLRIFSVFCMAILFLLFVILNLIKCNIITAAMQFSFLLTLPKLLLFKSCSLKNYISVFVNNTIHVLLGVGIGMFIILSLCLLYYLISLYDLYSWQKIKKFLLVQKIIDKPCVIHYNNICRLSDRL